MFTELYYRVRKKRKYLHSPHWQANFMGTDRVKKNIRPPGYMFHKAKATEQNIFAHHTFVRVKSWNSPTSFHSFQQSLQEVVLFYIKEQVLWPSRGQSSQLKTQHSLYGNNKVSTSEVQNDRHHTASITTISQQWAHCLVPRKQKLKYLWNK